MGQAEAPPSTPERSTPVSKQDSSHEKQQERELLRAQKLESLGTLAGGIAHDFNNLLVGIIANLEAAKAGATGMELDAMLEDARTAALRARALTQQLLTFSRGGAPVRKRASIGEIARESTSFAMRGSRSHCTLELGEGLWPVVVDAAQVGQVLQNLLVNAAQAMPDGGPIEVVAENVELAAQEVHDLAPGRYVKIAVRDEGPGVAEDALDKIFDPYFTTKQAGAGLGLTAAYSIIKQHGGHISARNRTTGVGACVFLYLPAEEAPKPRSGASVAVGSRRILVMDDDKLVRSAAMRVIRCLGYEVAGAEDGEQALALYREALSLQQPFGAVILDLTVPGGWGGMKTLEALREEDPAVVAIVSSGYSSDPIMARHEDFGFAGVVAKPYSMDELGKVLASVMVAG